ncbi:MAG: protein TolR [Gammaproteobacteria bacterium RIFCSPLOWO2_02_FULL_56_15]|nr:MAG: protein TolR [Gammaproteobacteria bacterium RIFCSPLOWO2_02_FULL_56_15]
MKPRVRKKPMSAINVVPYIDVMLVLLIIFMITAPLLSQGVKVDLPQAPSEPMPAEDREPVVISVDSAGKFYINYGENQDQPIDPQTLANRVSALLKYQPGIPVYLKGDQSVPYGRVVEAMAMLQRAGVNGVGLITDPPAQ